MVNNSYNDYTLHSSTEDVAIQCEVEQDSSLTVVAGESLSKMPRHSGEYE